MLIPVSYASIFGGCCTLVGTSTNILASGIMAESTSYPEMEPLGMFELSKIAFPLLAISLGVLVLFGRRLLPEREALSNIISDIDRKEFLTEAVVLEGSSPSGKENRRIRNSIPLRSSIAWRCPKGKSAAPNFPDLVLTTGDRLVLSCRPQGILEARELEALIC